MEPEIDQVATKLENCDLVANTDVEVMTKALLNPLILRKILCSLDAPTLKSVRLVCTAWADVGATFLGEKSFLRPSTPPNGKYEELTSFNPELGKNVQLLFYMTCNCTDICTCPANLPSNFDLILPNISAKLEKLEFLNVNAFQPLQEILSAYHFPNLTHIWIIAHGEDLDKKASLSRDMAEFRHLPKLKVILLRMSPCFTKDSSRDVMSRICQNLVNSAPNLEEVDLNANFNLDFTACGKLKKLQVQHFSWGSFQFETSKMPEMLESCRNSLKSLTLDYLGWNYGPTELTLHLTNLTHLVLNAADVYNIKGSLNVTNLPKLTHFSISNNDSMFEIDISEILEHYYLRRHIGITSLDVCGTHYPIPRRAFTDNEEDGQAAGRLVNVFPAVKELKLKLLIQYFSDYDQHFFTLRETIESFGEWEELTRGQVELKITSYSVSGIDDHPDHCFGLDLIIAVLRGMAGWRGLANTWIKFTGDRRNPAEFILCDAMRAALLSCRTSRSLAFTGFLMDEEAKDVFKMFIRENNLPIYIPN